METQCGFGKKLPLIELPVGLRFDFWQRHAVGGIRTYICKIDEFPNVFLDFLDILRFFLFINYLS